MNVVCPACSKQHRVSDQMAGKRAKCSCGEVISIPAAPAAAQPAPEKRPNEFAIQTTPKPAPHAPQAPTSGLALAGGSGEILFECRYGVVRSFLWWLMGANLIIAVVLIPAGILWNEGWEIRGAELPAWGATLLFEGVAVVVLLIGAYTVGGHFLHRKKPQRVAVTAAGVIIPKGKLSREELFIPWAEVRVKRWGGPVEQLDFKRGGLRNTRLTSIQFPTDEDYESLLDCLRDHDKL